MELQREKQYVNGLLLKDKLEADKAQTNQLAQKKTVTNYLTSTYQQEIDAKRAEKNLQVSINLKFRLKTLSLINLVFSMQKTQRTRKA